MKFRTFFHTGDLGDIIAALPVIRQLGGGHLVVGNRNGSGAREPMTGKRFEAIEPLLLAQPFLAGVRFENDARDITHDFSTFRKTTPEQGHSLATWQAAHFGIKDLDLSPWLTVSPSLNSAGMTVLARSPRYHNLAFDWRAVLAARPRSVFIGMEEEARQFIQFHGSIYHARTANLLHAAQLIAGSELFVGNQSCPCWLAIGLGHPLIQEVCTWTANSIVPRANAHFVSTRDDLASALERANVPLESPALALLGA